MIHYNSSQYFLSSVNYTKSAEMPLCTLSSCFFSSMFKVEDGSLLYGVCQTLVNLTNSYDKPEQDENTEKMKELGKFAKVNIPEFDEKVCFSYHF